jgi:hypothetical protein
MANGILYGENYAPVIVGGDLKVGFTDEQDMELLMVSHTGELVSKPTIGFGASRYLNRRDPELAPAELFRELKADGFVAIKTKLDPNTADLVASANRPE